MFDEGTINQIVEDEDLEALRLQILDSLSEHAGRMIANAFQSADRYQSKQAVAFLDFVRDLTTDTSYRSDVFFAKIRQALKVEPEATSEVG